MKILSTADGKFLEYLDRSGIFGEVMSYQDVYDSAPEDDLYDVLLIDVSDGKAEGLYTPRTLLDNGHKLPVIGILDDMEIEGERGFEEAQATFIDQGGLYLLKSSPSPALLKACIAQAASIGKPLTAAAALHFVEQGLLDLDENVNDALVSWQIPENEFTKQEKVTRE